MKRNESTPLILLTNINSKQSKDINLKLDTMKLLEENIRKKVPDLSLGNNILDITPKNISKSKNFCTTKETINNVKRQLTKCKIYL